MKRPGPTPAHGPNEADTPARCTCADGGWEGLHGALSAVAQGILAVISEGTERVDDGVLFLAAELVEDVPVDMHVRRTLIGLYDLTTQLSHRPHGPVEALRPVASALLIAYRSLVAGQQPDQIAGALEPVIAALGAAPR